MNKIEANNWESQITMKEPYKSAFVACGNVAIKDYRLSLIRELSDEFTKLSSIPPKGTENEKFALESRRELIKEIMGII